MRDDYTYANLDQTKLSENSIIVNLKGPVYFSKNPSDRDGLISSYHRETYDFGFLIYFEDDYSGQHCAKRTDWIESRSKTGKLMPYSFTLLDWIDYNSLELVLRSIRHHAR